MKSGTAMIPASTGHSTHVLTIVANVETSVTAPLKMFQPTMAPTIACVVETGRPHLVMYQTASPAARAQVNAPARASTAPSRPSVSVVPAPLTTAPRMTNTLHTSAAVVNRIMRVPTADPKTLAASFAPSDQPRKSPLESSSSAANSTRLLEGPRT